MRRLLEALLRMGELAGSEIHLQSLEELPEGITANDMVRLRAAIGDVNMKCRALIKIYKYGVEDDEDN